MRTYIGLLVLGFVALGCTLDPKKIKIAPGSANGMLVLQIEPLRDAYLSIQEFDPQSHKIKRWLVTFDLDKTHANNFQVHELPPGNYIMLGLTQQHNWITCMYERSVSFEVKAGEVLFLGKFNPDPGLLQLQSLASKDRIAINGHRFIYFDNILPPAIVAPSAAEIEELKRVIAEEFPLISAPIRAGEFKPDYFQANLEGELFKNCGVLD
jgi:hypothetical protein